MHLAVALTADIAKNAGVAYVHYVSFMLCFGALVLERKLIKANPDRGEATSMVITDIVYGIAALALLVSGILRVIHFGQDLSSTRRIHCSGGRSVCTCPSAGFLCTQRSLTSSGRSPCARVNCLRSPSVSYTHLTLPTIWQV